MDQVIYWALPVIVLAVGFATAAGVLYYLTHDIKRGPAHPAKVEGFATSFGVLYYLTHDIKKTPDLSDQSQEGG